MSIIGCMAKADDSMILVEDNTQTLYSLLGPPKGQKRDGVARNNFRVNFAPC